MIWNCLLCDTHAQFCTCARSVGRAEAHCDDDDHDDDDADDGASIIVRVCVCACVLGAVKAAILEAARR